MGRSSRRRTNTAAPAALTSRRSPRSTISSERAKSISAPRSICIPALRSARPNATDCLSRRRPSTAVGGASMLAALGPGAGGRLGEVGLCRRPADVPDVLLVLQYDAKGLVEELRRELRGTEGHERGGPVERLGDAGDLGQVRP